MTLEKIDSRILSEFEKRAGFPLTESNLLVLARIGSPSHNTSIPELSDIQDEDFMGVVFPPVDTILGLNTWESLHFQVDELDCVFYSVKFFIKLAQQNNPNVITLLWLRDDFYIHAHDPEWECLQSIRNAFSSKLLYNTFTSYAHGQMAKMKNMGTEELQKYDLGLKVIEDLKLDPELVYEGRFDLGDKTDAILYDYIEVHKKFMSGYMGAKRKELVRKFGYDTKNAAHLIRLLTMCGEFFRTGYLTVYLEPPTDSVIRDIKSGKHTLEFVKEYAARLFETARFHKDTSTLREKPLFEVINRTLIDLHWRYIYRELVFNR